MVLLGGFEPPTLPNLGTYAGYKPGVLPLNYRSNLEDGVGFKPTVLTLCRRLHWVSLPTVHKLLLTAYLHKVLSTNGTVLDFQQ